MVPPGQFPGPGHNNNHILPPTGQMGMMVPSGQFPGPGHNNNTLPSMGQMSPGMMPSYPSQHPSQHPFGLGAHPGSGPGPRYMIRSLVDQVLPPSFSISPLTSQLKLINSEDSKDKEVKDLIITVSVFEVLTVVAILIFRKYEPNFRGPFLYKVSFYFFLFWFILLFILNTVFTAKLSKSMKYKKNGGAIFLTCLTYVTLLVLFFIILRCTSRLTPTKKSFSPVATFGRGKSPVATFGTPNYL